MSSERPVLIAALSGRALAASARRGGYQPLVADFFADQDTIAIAQCVRMQGNLAQGFEADELLPALERLAAGRTIEGLVCGTGFEDRPSLLASLGERWPLVGNTAELVARVTDPYSLAALARQTGVPHPEISRHPPSDPTEWLVKRIGGAGGSHIATPHEGSSPSHYFQRRVAGQAIAALVLSDGVNPMVLGFSQQWCAPTKRRPFRYGGAVRPALLDPTIEHRLTVMTQNLLKAARLVGLNSVDFLVDGETIWMLEINPRPGATLDLFEPEGVSLFALHVAACRGALPDHKPELTHAEASAIIYAQADVPKIAPIDWPEWTTDHPLPSIRIEAGDPLCTIRAVAARPPEARALLNARRDTLATMIKASLS